MDPLFQCYCIPYVSLYSELINDLFLYSPIPAGRTMVALSHHSNTNLHSTHTSTRLHKLADMPNVLQPAHSFILSFPPPSAPLFCSSVPLCLAMPCTNISIYLPPAFLGHWAPPTFIHTMPCFVFMLARWGDGVIDGGMILCFNNRSGRSRRQHP